MRLAFCLVFGFISAQLTAAPIPKEAPKAKVPNYFPCELGTKWEYVSGKEPVVVEVTKVRYEPGSKIVTFTHTWQMQNASVDHRYRVTKDGSYYFQEDNQINGEMLVLKSDAKPGDRIANSMPGHFLDGAITTIREPMTVETPAGKFDVIGSSVTLNGVPADKFQITHFYADGVGLVLIPGGGRKTTSFELKKFTPPAK